MKKILALALSAALAIGIAGCSNPGASSTPNTPSTPGTSGTQPGGSAPQNGGSASLIFTLPTGSMGGSYYSSGTAMAQIFNTYVDGMEMSVSASNSQDNIGMLESGEVNFGYQSLNDLRGQKIQMGASGSGQYLLNAALIEALGLTTNDYQPEYMNQNDGTQAFIEGKVEANMIASGVPSALLTQMRASDPDYRILTWDDAFLDKFLETYSYYKVCTVEPEDLDCGSVTEAVRLPAFYGELLVRADVDEEVVYNMCKAMYDHHEELVAAYAGCGFCTPEHAVEFTSYNLHPGAARYFTEIGVL